MSDIPQHGVDSTAAIARHPIHPMIIPFPIAALVGAFVSDLLALNTGDAFWVRASYTLLIVGLATGLLATLFGVIDFSTIKRVRQVRAGLLHAGGNALALLLTIANLLVRDIEALAVPGVGVVLSAVVAAMLVVTGWLGGELSYRHKVGVMEPTPNPGQDDRARVSPRV